ncbi:MAG: glycosyltransferase family 39 protein, partial [Dehalococcoidia bacterium]|nr:glycosyltransferase family 39 protein [Dehalococcoidia bacterium]
MDMEETIKRSFKKLIHWQYFPLLVLLLVILGLHLATITRPDALLFDEHHYITDARRILTGEGTDRTEHPPLAKLLIVGGVELFGDNQWGWRLPSVLISTVALIAFYDICRKLGTSHKTAFIATMLLGLDNLMFIHSGIAMLDIYLVAFTIFAFWSYLKGQRWWWLSAVFIGLAGLCKFSGALAVIPIGLHWFISYMSNTVPRTKNPPSALSEASVVDTPESVHTEEYPAIETGVAASATTDSEQSADTYITTVQSTNSVQIAETSTRSTSSAPLAEETAQASSAEAVRPSFWKTYSNPIIFFASMILAPVTFFLFYGILDMIIWGKWIPFVVWGHWDEGVLGTIRRALNSTNSIKFAYGGAFPSRPWEWLLSPSGSLYFYGALFRPENYKDIALAYWFKPSYTGMINPSIWLGGLMTIPYVI